MRSTLASFYSANGLSDTVASKSLGHSSTQVTQDYNLRPVESELQRTAQMVEEKAIRRIMKLVATPQRLSVGLDSPFIRGWDIIKQNMTCSGILFP